MLLKKGRSLSDAKDSVDEFVPSSLIQISCGSTSSSVLVREILGDRCSDEGDTARDPATDEEPRMSFLGAFSCVVLCLE